MNLNLPKLPLTTSSQVFLKYPNRSPASHVGKVTPDCWHFLKILRVRRPEPSETKSPTMNKPTRSFMLFLLLELNDEWNFWVFQRKQVQLLSLNICRFSNLSQYLTLHASKDLNWNEFHEYVQVLAHLKKVNRHSYYFTFSNVLDNKS